MTLGFTTSSPRRAHQLWKSHLVQQERCPLSRHLLQHILSFLIHTCSKKVMYSSCVMPYAMLCMLCFLYFPSHTVLRRAIPHRFVPYHGTSSQEMPAPMPMPIFRFAFSSPISPCKHILGRRLVSSMIQCNAMRCNAPKSMSASVVREKSPAPLIQDQRHSCPN